MEIENTSNLIKLCPPGRAICDMHYGSVRSFRLPKSLETKLEVVSAVMVEVHTERQINHFCAWIEAMAIDAEEWMLEGDPAKKLEVRRHTYVNKMLVPISYQWREHEMTVTAAFLYDGRYGGVVELRAITEKK